MTLRDSAFFVAWASPSGLPSALRLRLEESLRVEDSPWTRGDDSQRRVRFGKTKFRRKNNLLVREKKMLRQGKLVFPHLTRRRTRNVPNHGLESRATKRYWRGIATGYSLISISRPFRNDEIRMVPIGVTSRVIAPYVLVRNDGSSWTS